MKNTRLIVIVWIVGALLCACTSEVEEQLSFSNSETVSFIMNEFESEAESRTALAMEGNSAIFTWAEKDTVGIYPDEGDQVSFSMGAGLGSNSATFDGGAWDLKSSHTYYAYYPFDRKNFNSQDSKNAIPVSYKGQVQVGNNNTKHIGKYAYMTAVGTSPTNGSLTFNFNHLSTLLIMNATMQEATTLVSVTVDTDFNSFAAEGTYDLSSASPSIIPTESVQSLKLELQDVSLTNGNLSFVGYMMISPGPKTITVILEDDKGKKYYSVLEKKFNAGSYYRVNITDEGVYSNGVARLTKAGTLATVLGTQKLTLTELKIVGEINSTDLHCLREMAGCVVDVVEEDGYKTYVKGEGRLTKLDLSNATIVEGGSYMALNGVNELEEVTANADKLGDFIFKESQLIEITLPNNLKGIDVSSFRGCIYLSQIALPNSVSYIDHYAFCGCPSLKNVTINEGVQTVGSYAFSDCSSLARLVFPNSVTTIKDNVINRCSKLKEVTFGTGIQSIDYNDNLPSSSLIINCYAIVPPTISSSTFHYSSSLHVPDGYDQVYKAASIWKNFPLIIDDL